MSQTFPVYVQRSGQRVQVGTASRQQDGSFLLQLGELVIGAQAQAGQPTSAPRAAPAPVGPGGLPTVFPNYGRSKGAPISGASQQDLEYYANGARRSLADPSKERFHDKERALLAAIDQELARQGSGGGGGGGGGERSDGGGYDDGDPFGGEEPPPPGDEDNIPF